MKRKSVLYSSFITLIALLNLSVYWSMRPIWFFINKDLGSLFNMSNFWTIFILFLFMANSIYSIVLLITHIYSNEIKYIVNPKGKLNILLPIIFNLILCAANMYLYSMLGSEKNIVIRNLLTLLPGLLVVTAILFCIIVFPTLNISKKTNMRYIFAGLIIITYILCFSNIANVKITSGPYFQYVDENSFAVIWTTNKKSTGYIEYGLDETNLTTAISSDKGIVNANTTYHKVILNEPLDSNTIFRVASRKINQYYQNNIEFGNTVYSEFINYENNKDIDETHFLILSDIHEKESLYDKMLTQSNYDFLVLNGDLVSSVDSEEVLIDEFLQPLSSSIDGFKPFYFTRGNHETRGAFSRELPNYLALPNGDYYYTFTYGPIFAIVLDSAEDKVDSHEEYSGLANFEEYRETQTAWLQTVLENEEYLDSKYVIAFSHIPLETDSESSYINEWTDLLNAIEIDVLFSGHTHDAEIIEKNELTHKYPIIIAGGYSDEKNFVGIQVDANKNQLQISLIDEDGLIVMEYTIDK